MVALGSVTNFMYMQCTPVLYQALRNKNIMDEMIIATLSLCCSFGEVCSFRSFSDFSVSRLLMYVGQCPKRNERKIYFTRLHSVVRSAIILSTVISFKVCKFPNV
jgi:hypothetical protein